MRGMALVMLLAVVACGSLSTPKAQSSTNPNAVPSATADSTPSPSPGTTPSARTSFACRLPVTTLERDVLQGGFVTFPAGTYEADAAGLFTRDSTSGRYRSAAVPVLLGMGMNVNPSPLRPDVYYDRALQRWLPAGRQTVSPDGTRYAYVDGEVFGAHRLHVVDVRTGSEKLITDGLPSEPMRVIDFTAAGIYIAASWEVGNGVALVDPASGKVSGVDGWIGTSLVLDDVVWETRVDPRDQHPAGWGMGAFPNSLARLDLRTRHTDIWFYQSSTAVGLVGLGLDGEPVITVTLYNTPTSPDAVPISERGMILTAPDTGTTITVDAAKAVPLIGPNSIHDLHGWWQPADDGIYLYLPGGTKQKVFDVAAKPANGCA